MGFSLKGVVTGLATTFSDIMDEERKETNKLVSQRTKNAYDNYSKYQETTEALRADIKKKDAQALQYQADLTDGERVAIASMPNAIDLYEKVLASGKQVTLRDMIKVGDKAAGMKFDDFVNELGKVQPVDMIKTEAPKKFFGTSEAKQLEMMEKTAGVTGVQPKELMAYERMPAAPSVSSMGSMKLDAFQKTKAPVKSVEEAFEESQLLMMNAERDKGKDSPEYKAAEASVKLAASYIKTAPETLSKRADRLRNAVIDEADPAKKARLNEELGIVEKSIKGHALATSARAEGDGGDKKKTYSQIKSSVNDYVNTRMRDEEGASWRKYVDFKTTKMEDGTTFVSRTQKAEMPVEEQRKMFDSERRLTKEALLKNNYITTQGVPVYSAVAEIMNNMNIPVGPMAAPSGFDEPAAAPIATPAPAAVSKPATLGAAPAGRNAAPVAKPLPAPKTQAEYDAIPPNTEYVDTDGKTKRKGGK